MQQQGCRRSYEATAERTTIQSLDQNNSQKVKGAKLRVLATPSEHQVKSAAVQSIKLHRNKGVLSGM